MTIYRGAMVSFSTTFYDANGNVVQPLGATVNLVYTIDDLTQSTASISMVAPVAPAVVWTAQWDSRGAEPGTVFFSIHTTGPNAPYSVEDENSLLAANNANLVTF